MESLWLHAVIAILLFIGAVMAAGKIEAKERK